MRCAKSFLSNCSQLLPAYSLFSNKLSAFWQNKLLKSCETMAWNDCKYEGVVRSTRRSNAESSRMETIRHILMNREPSNGLCRFLLAFYY